MSSFMKNIDKVENVDTQKTKRLLIVITKNASIDIYRKRSSHMPVVDAAIISNLDDKKDDAYECPDKFIGALFPSVKKSQRSRVSM